MGKPDDPGFEYLRKLTLKNARLSHADLKNLSLAFRCGKLPRLNDLNLSSNTLTGSLADLLFTPAHHRFTSLKTLQLKNTKLSKMDVKSLSSAVAFGKLPVLKHLSLSCNTLTQCLEDLFGCVFPRLRRLYVNNAQLCGIDMKSLCKAVEDGKIPKLKVLNLSDNNLTDTVADLLATDYLTLKKLWLCNSRLSEGDIKSLSAAFREDKLKGLTDLTLVGNNLENQLGNFFRDSKGFSSLKRLRLQHCQLGNDDIECLWEAVDGLALHLLDIRENCLSLDQVAQIAGMVNFANCSRYE